MVPAQDFPSPAGRMVNCGSPPEAARLQLPRQGRGAGLPSWIPAAAGGQRPRPAFSGLAKPF